MERRVASVLLQGRDAERRDLKMKRHSALHPSDFFVRREKKEDGDRAPQPAPERIGVSEQDRAV